MILTVGLPVAKRLIGARRRPFRSARECTCSIFAWRIRFRTASSRGAARVQRREDEVTGLGGGERDRDRLEVPELPDQDHIGVLPERGAQSTGERTRVGADLALVDHGELVLMHEFDRVLDGHDVTRPLLVDSVDHRGERRRLAAARGARDENEAARTEPELAQDRRHVHLLERRHLRRDEPHRRRHGVPVEERVQPEAPLVAVGVREVELPFDLERLLLLERRQPVDEVAHLLGVQLGQVEPPQHPADAEHGAIRSNRSSIVYSATALAIGRSRSVR